MLMPRTPNTEMQWLIIVDSQALSTIALVAVAGSPILGTSGIDESAKNFRDGGFAVRCVERPKHVLRITGVHLVFRFWL